MKEILLISVITALWLIPVEASPSRDSASDSGITESSRFDVFLNFRGPDSRYTVVDILYKTLTDAGVHVFLDDEHIRKGEVIEGELLRAITNSRIYIAILSKDYASSKWCLRELVMMIDFWKRSMGQEEKVVLDCRERSIGQRQKAILHCWERSVSQEKEVILDLWERAIAQEKELILDCRERSVGQEKKTILPIFHGVSVSEDVKLRSELYTSALQKHKEKLGEAVVKPWEDALKEIATIKGWNLRDDGLTKLANLIKKRVLSDINANEAIPSVPDRLAGIKDRMEDIMLKLQPILDAKHCKPTLITIMVVILTVLLFKHIELVGSWWYRMKPMIPDQASPSQDSASDDGTTDSRGFDVYLSFQGPDSRDTIVAILYNTLTNAGFRVFLDSEKCRNGEVMEEQVFGAIMTSRIYIPIFSKNYVSSRRCLCELAKIVEAYQSSSVGEEKVILPIFYDVTVEDMELIYTSALQKHKKNLDIAVVKSWADALLKVSKIKRWHLCDHGICKLANLIKERVHREISANEAFSGVRDRLVDIHGPIGRYRSVVAGWNS